jgi:malate dehydrogenase (oxaloacetate-decarboxylating)(NADP+)
LEKRKQDALDYHSKGRPGKIEVVPTKPHSTQRDLALAYSPGVAVPCMQIHENEDDVYKYTAKGNLVAVISNGTAVLGLGDIGPLASKPVMEGKGLLFKIYADIDVFDIEIDASDPDKFIETVKAISPTFGGINLEDIKAPDAFHIEEVLKEELNIPIMHDDQHGTAIISGAALLNALEITGKKIEEVSLIVSGAGAAAISCAKLYVSLGMKRENIKMFDSKGLLHQNRNDLDKYKQEFAFHDYDQALEEAFHGADIFLGLSKGNLVNKEMIKAMAPNPIVFALANPDPEISYQDAMDARKDIIMATGRSDNPNQVNNVLGFPYIFRGALDVRATKINEEMKIAAVRAIAKLTKESVPEEVNMAYGGRNLSFGPEYIIPKPFDPRLISHVSPAVAQAAMDSGVAKKHITNWPLYKLELNKRLGLDNKLLRQITQLAKKNPKRIVFAEADHYPVLKAAQIVWDEGIGIPILLGNSSKINSLLEENHIDMEGALIIDPKAEEWTDTLHQYAKIFWQSRMRKGETLVTALKKLRDRNHFGAMMVDQGDADVMITGVTQSYPACIRPVLQIIGLRNEVKVVAGMYAIQTKNGPIFLADTTINKNPSAVEVAEIAMMASNTVMQFGIVPRVALLSYSNFGSTRDESTEKMAHAREILKRKVPDLIVDGEMQGNFALNTDLLQSTFPFSELSKYGANILIFPNLESGNISYKLVQEIAGVDSTGPILLGMKKAVHVLQLGSSVNEIVNMAIIGVADAQVKES